VYFHSGVDLSERNLIHHGSDDEHTTPALLEQIVLIERIGKLIRDKTTPFILYYEFEGVFVTVAGDVNKFGGVTLISVQDAIVDNFQ
jgi:hypothetical protein